MGARLTPVPLSGVAERVAGVVELYLAGVANLDTTAARLRADGVGGDLVQHLVELEAAFAPYEGTDGPCERCWPHTRCAFHRMLQGQWWDARDALIRSWPGVSG